MRSRLKDRQCEAHLRYYFIYQYLESQQDCKVDVECRVSEATRKRRADPPQTRSSIKHNATQSSLCMLQKRNTHRKVFEQKVPESHLARAKSLRNKLRSALWLSCFPPLFSPCSLSADRHTRVTHQNSHVSFTPCRVTGRLLLETQRCRSASCLLLSTPSEH